MEIPRRTAMLGAVLAASLLGEAAAAAQPSKLDARLRARRAVSAAGGYAPAAAGGAAGPSRSVLIRVSPGTPLSALRAAYPGAAFGSQAGDVITARAGDAALDALALDPRVREIGAAVRARPLMDAVRSSSTSSGLGLGTIYGAALTDLAGATGAGVVVGVVDTGIDYTHRDFLIDNTYPGTSTSRILALWDQTISTHDATGGPFPSGWDYGVEYTNAQLTAKVRTGAGTINTSDTDGHGTHVASIAAGDGTGTNGAIPSGTFKGMSPSADLIVVRTTFSTADVVDGVNFIVARAAAAGKRAVINLSLGTQSGPHDGTSLFESSIGAIAASTPVVVAMGNDGALKPHAGMSIGVAGSAGAVVSVDAATADADIEFWHPGGDAYTVQVTLAGIGGSVTASAGTDQSAVLGTHNVYVYNGTDAGHPLGHEKVLVYVNRSAGITASAINVTFTRTTSGGTGRVDGWIDPGQGVSFAAYIDNTRTLGEPACALNVFGVGSYASKKFWNGIDGFTYSYTSQVGLGSLSAFSSQGPTRDGRQQPEVVAPGDVIAGALSSTAYPGDAYVLGDASHRIMRGTSMAAPVVTGILAARLQYGPGRTVAGLREILRAQARTDSATGVVPTYSWGYGKASSSPQPVSPPTGLAAATMGPSSVTWTWGSAVGADAYSLYYATNPTVLLAAGVQSPYVHTGLAANTTTGVVIKGNGGGVDGPGAFISTSTLAAAPAALPTVTPHVDSATVSWTPCPASPAALSCWGYSVTASTAPGGGGTQFAAQTTDRSVSSLIVAGLQPLTQYYFRQATRNSYGAATATGPVSATTLTDLVAPINPQFSGATVSSMRFDWNGAGNPAGIVYNADASTSPAFAGAVLSSATRNQHATFTGMTTNASYYFRVQATGGPYLAPAAPVPTLAAAPVLSTAPFSAVSQTGFAVQWSSGGNSAGTQYRAEASASPAFSPLAASSVTRNGYAAFSGLTPNTLYYARALAISHGGITSEYASFGSTPTFVLDPTLPAEPFSNQSSDGFTFSFNSGGNSAGTVYTVRVSTNASFAPLTASVNTTGGSASFSGLSSNRRYYADVAALNLSGTPTAYTAAASTATTVVAPGAPASPVSARTTASLSTTWTAGTLGPGTSFAAQASAFANFSVVASASTTANAFATLSGLAANTVHYLRVRALSLNAPTPDGPWTTIGSASTLAAAPSAAATPFPLVGVASVTVAWSALPLAPQASACEGYRAELAADPAFTSIVASSVVAPGAATANFSGLSYGTPYYARVASLDWEGNPNYLVIGSTRTNAPTLSSGTVAGGALTLALPSAFAVLPGVTAQIDPGTFPPGTVVTMLSGVTLDLSNPRSSAAGLTALGNAVGIDISAGGLQPLKPVRLTMTYDPLLLPPGSDPRRLLIARYDEASALWVMVPSAVNASAGQIVATLDHFSSYSPFFAAAGASVSDGVVFPQPWEAGGPGGSYGAQALTFANYPSGTTIRLMSLTGEQVWKGTAGPNGVLTWDGRNAYGRPVASGTYYALIEGAGSRKVRRVVVIR
ncbi:MAG: S8 family serine peptidase [Elusimicrobia bacterium]|nr:S8 family serine peptidase [Elusimicrobiota bacterium]